MSKAKFEDWEYMLKSAIYLSLIGYNDSNGHTIPCKTRGEMEDAILSRFTQSMKQDKYQPPQPQQKAEGISTAEILNTKKQYNKWLNELTAYEVSCIFDMMEEYANQFKQSQPTAGEYYAKDQMLVAFAMGYERKSKELDWSYFKPTAGGVKNEIFEQWLLKNAWRRLDDNNYAHEYKTWGGFAVYKKTEDSFAEYLKSQPSPSNPSIKRPTEEEIRQGFKHKYRDDLQPAPSFLECWTDAINWLLSIQPDKL